MNIETRKTAEIDRISRKIESLRSLSPAGFPWAKVEIEKLEKELQAMEGN